MGFSIFLVLLLVVGFGGYFALRAMLSSSMKLSLELEPDQLLLGDKVKIHVKAAPGSDTKLNLLDGQVMIKKYDNFKNSWTDRSDIPVISSGIIIKQIKFSFGNQIVLKAGEENLHTGVIPIPEDLPPTEVRGVINVHWFVIIRAQIAPFLPPVKVYDELIVERKEIFDHDKLGDDDSEFVDLYDPSFDLNDDREKEVKFTVTSVVDEETGKVSENFNFTEIIPERAAGEEETAESIDAHKLDDTSTTIMETPEPAKPIKIAAPVDLSDRLKVEYQAPFDPARRRMEEAGLIPSDDKKEEPAAPAAPAPVSAEKEEDLSDKLKVEYQAPFDPAKKLAEQAAKAQEEDLSDKLKVEYQAPFDPAKKLAEQAAKAEKEDLSDKLKVEYQAPFDPAKKLAEQAAQAQETAVVPGTLGIPGFDDQEKTGPSFHKPEPTDYATRYSFKRSAEKAKLKTAEVSDKFKERHRFASRASKSTLKRKDLKIKHEDEEETPDTETEAAVTETKPTIGDKPTIGNKPTIGDKPALKKPSIRKKRDKFSKLDGF